MDDDPAGALRPSSGPLVPQAHGGALRRGGGAPARSDDQARAYRLLREGAADAAAALLAAARGGDTRAAIAVLAYSIGRPPQRLEMAAEGACARCAFVGDLDDRERLALREAVDRELGRRAP